MIGFIKGQNSRTDEIKKQDLPSEKSVFDFNTVKRKMRGKASEKDFLRIDEAIARSERYEVINIVSREVYSSKLLRQ